LILNLVVAKPVFCLIAELREREHEMTNLWLRLAVTFVALGVASCGTFSGGETEGRGVRGAPVLTRVLDSGILRIGVSGSQPPFNVMSKNEEIIGLEADLGTALAFAIGLRPVFETMEFSQLIGALERGEIDIVMSGMAMTPERNARVAFVGPYYISGKGLVTRSEKLAQASESSEINSRDLRLVAMKGSTSFDFISDNAPRAELLTSPDHQSGISMVIEGSADAMVADFPACVLAILLNPDSGLATILAPFTFEPIGIALPPGDSLFITLVENYLNLLQGTGLLEQLQLKWFADAAWLAELP